MRRIYCSPNRRFPRHHVPSLDTGIFGFGWWSKRLERLVSRRAERGEKLISPETRDLARVEAR